MGKSPGRPRKPPEQKKHKNGFTVSQWERICLEASRRGVSAAAYQRQIVDWYFSALDAQKKPNDSKS